jgi:hypothetical protein
MDILNSGEVEGLTLERKAAAMMMMMIISLGKI